MEPYVVYVLSNAHGDNIFLCIHRAIALLVPCVAVVVHTSFILYYTDSHNNSATSIVCHSQFGGYFFLAQDNFKLVIVRTSVPE